jgi:hypothetical protein
MRAAAHVTLKGEPAERGRLIGAGQTEIGHLGDLTAGDLCHQDVCGLDVAVDEALGVGIFKRFENLAD